MLTPSRDTDPVQERRIRLDHAATEMRYFIAIMRPMSLQSGSERLREAIPRVEKALDEVEAEHARIDFELLVACTRPWSHPVQAIGSPRAPYGRVVACCEKHLAGAQGEERARVASVHERVRQAHHFSETARRRRLQRRIGALEEVAN